MGIWLWVLVLSVLFAMAPYLGDWERRRNGSTYERGSAGWAAERLRPDDFRIEPGHGVGRVVLLREVVIDGLACKAHTEVVFGLRGGLQRATLARDCTVEGLPLEGDTAVTFDFLPGGLAGGTLASDVVVDGVPCAAGPVVVSSGWGMRLVQATLARDAVVCGLACRAGTEVEVRRGMLPRRLRRATPTVQQERWGFRCAADHEIDFDERSATLGEDARYFDVSLPRGSRFGLDLDFGLLWVTLAGSTRAYGHVLAPGTSVEFFERDPAKRSVLGRWLATFSARSAHRPLLGAWRAFPWDLGGLRVAAYARVRIDRRGVATVRIEEDHLLHGVRYPKGSELSIDAKGRVVGWRAECPVRREPRQGPYRSPVGG